MSLIRSVIKQTYQSRRHLARFVKGGKTSFKDRTTVSKSVNIQPLSTEETWIQVTDDSSGEKYWWNQTTNETTHLGAPDPRLAQNTANPPPPAQQQSGMLSGLGGVMAEGFAFGVGSSIARSAVNAMFDSMSGDDDGGDDSVDI